MKALEIDPSYAYAQNNLGVLLWHKSEPRRDQLVQARLAGCFRLPSRRG
jgi:hypothetical protein